MSFMFSPGCCCVDCVIFRDTFERADDTDVGADWDELSGDWAIVSNELEGVGAGILLADTAYNESAPTVVSVHITALETSGDKGRVIIAYTDANNYLYAQVENDAGAGKLKLFKVVAGTHTQLGTTRTLSMWNLGDIWLIVCYQEGILAAEAHFGTSGGFGFPGTSVMSKAVTATGTRHGLAVGGGTVLFNNYLLERHEDEENGCRNCARFCTQCEDELEPRFYQVEISGVVGGAAPYLPCLNGTHIIPAGDCGGWKEGPCYPAEPTAPRGFGVVIGTGAITVYTIQGCGFGTGQATWYKSDAPNPVPCRELSAVSIPWLALTPGCFSNDFSSSTCLITSIP